MAKFAFRSCTGPSRSMCDGDQDNQKQSRHTALFPGFFGLGPAFSW